MLFDALVVGDEVIDQDGETYIVLIAQPSEVVVKVVCDNDIPDFNYFIFHRSQAGNWVDREDPTIVLTEIV